VLFFISGFSIDHVTVPDTIRIFLVAMSIPKPALSKKIRKFMSLTELADRETDGKSGK